MGCLNMPMELISDIMVLQQISMQVVGSLLQPVQLTAYVPEQNCNFQMHSLLFAFLTVHFLLKE